MAAAAKKPAAPRIDPKPRRLGGPAAGNQVVNPDPRFRYVFVTPGKVSEYEAYGYELARYVKGGARPATFRADSPEGSIMEWMGMQLMQIPVEDWQVIVQEGLSGDGGQRLADELERQVTSEKDEPGLRKIPGIEMRNDTKPAEVEWA